MPPHYYRDLAHGPGVGSGLLPRLPPPTCSRGKPYTLNLNQNIPGIVLPAQLPEHDLGLLLGELGLDASGSVSATRLLAFLEGTVE